MQPPEAYAGEAARNPAETKSSSATQRIQGVPLRDALSYRLFLTRRNS
jgi:hypothetical protein